MGGYDDCKVASLTASQGASTNGLSFPLRIHKVVGRHTDGSAQGRVQLYDAATATGTSIEDLTADEVSDGAAFEIDFERTYDPPIAIDTGVSSTLAANTTAKIYYTRR